MAIKLLENVELSQYCTIGLGGKARYLTHVNTESELVEAIEFALANNLPIHVLGEGSNTVFTDSGFDGIVLKDEIKGIEINDSGVVSAGSGESWDMLVETSVQRGFGGIEALSLIPGTVGAAPVQNIGAYGQELSDTFVSLKAYDLEQSEFVEFKKDDCGFGYRTSRFKQNPGRYIVTRLTLGLHRENMKPPFYTTLQNYFDKHSVTEFSPANVRSAVVDWRRSYLPEVGKVQTAGSFFTNPIIEKEMLDKIIADNPSIADWPSKWYWQLDNGKYKVSAGRLADNLGLKDYYDPETGIATWKNSAIVLVNQSANSYQQLATFRQNYLDKIQQAYGLSFEQEPIEV